jgi:hypothetical protein
MAEERQGSPVSRWFWWAFLACVRYSMPVTRPDFDIESLESNRFCVSLSLLRVSMNPTVDRRSAHGPKPGFVPRW